MAERNSYSVTHRVTTAVTAALNGVAIKAGVLGSAITAVISVAGNLAQTNKIGAAISGTVTFAGNLTQINTLGAAISAVISVTGDLNAVGYTPSLDFSDARNSQYTSVVGI